MGNKPSLLSIQLGSEGVYQAGETLQGKIVLNVGSNKKREIQGPLTLTLIGNEDTAVRYAKHLKKGHRQFLSVVLPLHDFLPHERVARGKIYTFPFSIPLSVSLPSSTSHYGKDGAGFGINYTIRASLGHSLHAERRLQMSSVPLPDEHVACMIQPQTFPIKAAGLVNMGSVSLGASLPDTQIGREDMLRLQLAIKNDSTADIRRVDIRIVEQYHWCTYPGKHGRSKTDETTIIQINNVDLPGIERHRIDRSSLRESYSKPHEHQNATYLAIHEALMSGVNAVSCRVPTIARDSYVGSLVEIRHFIEIKIQTGSLVNKPVLTIPVKIGKSSSSRYASSGPLHQEPLHREPVPSYSGGSSEESTSTAVPVEPEFEVATNEAYIPMAEAFTIPSNALEASMAKASENVIVLGGEAILSEESDRELSDLIPMAPPSPEQRPQMGPSLENLLRDMKISVNDYDILSSRLGNPQWLSVFRDMSPQDFGRVVRMVHIEFDQPRVATLLAPHVNGGNCFTCQYAAEAVRNSSEWNRATMVQRLLPMCVDVAIDSEIIRRELNEWDQTVTGRDFEDAIRASLQ